jgi:hypothetical protein
MPRQRTIRKVNCASLLGPDRSGRLAYPLQKSGALIHTWAQGAMGSGRMLPMLLRRFMAAGRFRRRFTMNFEDTDAPCDWLLMRGGQGLFFKQRFFTKRTPGLQAAWARMPMLRSTGLEARAACNNGVRPAQGAFRAMDDCFASARASTRLR